MNYDEATIKSYQPEDDYNKYWSQYPTTLSHPRSHEHPGVPVVGGEGARLGQPLRKETWPDASPRASGPIKTSFAIRHGDMYAFKGPVCVVDRLFYFGSQSTDQGRESLSQDETTRSAEARAWADGVFTGD